MGNDVMGVITKKQHNKTYIKSSNSKGGESRSRFWLMTYLNAFFVLFLFSCSEPGGRPEENAMAKDSILKASKEISSKGLFQDLDLADGWIEVEMNGITFLFEKMDMDWEMADGAKEQKCVFKDTAFFNLWPGDWMEDKAVKVKGDEFEIIGLFVQEVTGIGVNSERFIEVPYCVLSDWKTFVSDWVELEPLDSQFRFETAANSSYQPLSLELNELKNAIRKSCGKDWYEEFRGIDSLDNMPYGETTIQYNYKIISREIKSGKTVEHIIVFVTPTTC